MIRLLGIVLLAALVSCQQPAVTDSGCPVECEVPNSEPEAYACPSGVYECPWDMACVGEICSDTCSSAYQCYPLDGCRSVDHTCGFCLEDTDCRSGEGCIEGVCLPATRPQWELFISADDLNLLETGASDTEVPCSLLADGVLYDQDVKVRLRGGSTRNLPQRSFRIEFPEDADHPGYQRKISLRAEYNDPSKMRNFLAFQTVRRWTSAPTPQVRYVDLYLRTDPAASAYSSYYGLMVELERLGGKFLDDNARDRELPLFEAKYVDLEGALTPSDAYDEIYVQHTAEGDAFDDLQSFIEDILVPDFESYEENEENTTQLALGAIRTESYLGYLASMAVLQCHDHVTNNFYFSYQYDGVEPPGWEFYAADLDMTFGCLWDSANHNPLCDVYEFRGWWLNGVFQWDDHVDLGVDPYWGNLAIHDVLSAASMRERYEDRVCGMISSGWWTQRLPDVVAALRVYLEPSIAEDWERWSSSKEQDFDFDYNASQEEVLGFLEDRREYLEGNLRCP